MVFSAPVLKETDELLRLTKPPTRSQELLENMAFSQTFSASISEETGILQENDEQTWDLGIHSESRTCYHISEICGCIFGIATFTCANIILSKLYHRIECNS